MEVENRGALPSLYTLLFSFPLVIFTLIDNDNLVGVFNRRKSMRDENDGHVGLLLNSVERSLDDLLGSSIEGRSGFVEDQNARLADETSSDSYSLLLAT